MSGKTDWVVLKFGGTSVATVANWRNIATVLQKRIAEGVRPLLVHSALSGVSDQLIRMLDLATAGAAGDVIQEIETRHRRLVSELGVEVSEVLEGYFVELRQLAAGISLIQEASDRTRARVLARGELMATEIGAAFLRRQGLAVTTMDARELLEAEVVGPARERSRWLSARCTFDHDPSLVKRLDDCDGVVMTQGFIARNNHGETVLLGRGGSDTSAAYFAARLGARRLEIWTDVPGMFTGDPRLVSESRLLKTLDYQEAQEIASSGASVLHPRCIGPARTHNIPVHIYATPQPDLEGTVITAAGDGTPCVKAISHRRGLLLLSLETSTMWRQVGFLADVFEIIRDHGLSVDLVSTSENNVTLSLDTAADQIDDDTIDELRRELGVLCRVRVVGPCAVVSLVGRSIRAILHRLGPALALFEEQRVYLVSQAANDLNFSLVIDEAQGDRIVRELHEILIPHGQGGPIFGPTWEQLHQGQLDAPAGRPEWWRVKRDALLRIAETEDCAYVYDLDSVDEAIGDLTAMENIDRLLYAIKANSHPDILRRAASHGLGLECVSGAEVAHVMETLPDLAPSSILFTPNFAPRGEYARALEVGVQLTLDSLYPLHHWPELFEGRQLFVRLDPGTGAGHHQHVRTAGKHSKFGVPFFELDELEKLVRRHGIEIIGLHAHLGSGILNHTRWRDAAASLIAAAARFPGVRVLDLGGGLGVTERSAQSPLDLDALNAALGEVKLALPKAELWMEPGRFIVSRAGVLIARVTQVKGKGDVRYVGIATGMNSLIRPALYGAHHEIVNLSRIDEAATEIVSVVGPICESGDYLGIDRLLPPCQEGDVLLIANTGAYGHVMSSHYNLRPPAREFTL